MGEAVIGMTIDLKEGRDSADDLFESFIPEKEFTFGGTVPWILVEKSPQKGRQQKQLEHSGRAGDEVYITEE